MIRTGPPLAINSGDPARAWAIAIRLHSVLGRFRSTWRKASRIAAAVTSLSPVRAIHQLHPGYSLAVAQTHRTGAPRSSAARPTVDRLERHHCRNCTSSGSLSGRLRRMSSTNSQRPHLLSAATALQQHRMVPELHFRTPPSPLQLYGLATSASATSRCSRSGSHWHKGTSSEHSAASPNTGGSGPPRRGWSAMPACTDERRPAAQNCGVVPEQRRENNSKTLVSSRPRGMRQQQGRRDHSLRRCCFPIDRRVDREPPWST